MFEIDNLHVIGIGDGTESDIEQRLSDGIIELDVKFAFREPKIPETITVEWFVKGDDCCSVWNPFMRCHSIRPDWSLNVMQSRLASGMPVQQIIRHNGNNKTCISVSDVDTPIKISIGYNEESANIICSVSFFTIPTDRKKEYSATVRIDMRNIPFYDSVYETVQWWENDLGYNPAYVPGIAKEPMDSLWYSFHQMLDKKEILEECKSSSELGIKTVIIDDGWQTDDNNRGYAFCGDWRVCESKMGDMASLIDEIHSLGMKVILWYSVPFMGINCEKYNEFKDMLLDKTGDEKTFFALDPRYKKVREYLCGVYETAVKEWGLDGLKLDFIDSFVLKGKSLEPDSARDFESLESAIHALLSDVCKRLLDINPDILIEFRQSYVGPSIRKYGNMLRVGDCPGDVLTNRSQIINLRLTSGKTAVHSDMVMWNKEDDVENAALQLANIIFAVPQISARINTLPENHVKMLKFYLDFMTENRDVLLDGKLTAMNPETEYSGACSTLGGKSVTAVYTNPVVSVNTSECLIVNASTLQEVVLKNANGKSYKAFDCTGELVCSGVIDQEVYCLPITTAGIIDIK